MNRDRKSLSLINFCHNRIKLLRGRVELLEQQLTSIAESLAKIAEPMMVVEQEATPPQACKNCEAVRDETMYSWKYWEFCSDTCIMEMALKLTDKNKGGK